LIAAAQRRVDSSPHLNSPEIHNLLLPQLTNEDNLALTLVLIFVWATTRGAALVFPAGFPLSCQGGCPLPSYSIGNTNPVHS
jgi:hypothetical protein